MSRMGTKTPGTRAVARQIEPGLRAECPVCEQPVKFNARTNSSARRQVIANVYVDGKWDRVEHFHAVCYEEAGSPYGLVETKGKS